MTLLLLFFFKLGHSPMPCYEILRILTFKEIISWGNHIFVFQFLLETKLFSEQLTIETDYSVTPCVYGPFISAKGMHIKMCYILVLK